MGAPTTSGPAAVSVQSDEKVRVEGAPASIAPEMRLEVDDETSDGEAMHAALAAKQARGAATRTTKDERRGGRTGPRLVAPGSKSREIHAHPRPAAKGGGGS